MNPSRRVVITGIGIVSPLGVGLSHVWKALIAGQSGIVSLDKTILANHPDVPCRIGGQVPLGSKSEGKWDASEWIEKAQLRRLPLFAQYAIAATQQALEDSNWFPQDYEDSILTGVSVGSGIGGFEDCVQNVTAFNSGGYKKVSPLFVPRLLCNMAAGNISIKYGFKGPNISPSTACTTGAHAIGDAANLISLGMADVMVAGSSEASLHPLSLAGFSRAKSVSTHFNDTPTQASRPFDKQRNGFVMGEGAGVMILEELEHAKARGVQTIYGEVVGYGMSGDGHHITAPPEDGDGARRSMQMAIKRAGIKPSQVGYVNAHATSTKIGDVAENAAICKVLMGNEEQQKALPGYFKQSPKEINISSSKGSIGHLLGGAGAVEAIFTAMALKDNVLPPTLNLEEPEDGFECNYVPKESQVPETPIEYAMSNSFGFGGTNASLLLKRWEA